MAKVLRPGGIYRTKHYQPAIHVVEPDGEGYRITAPYAETIYRRDDGGIEFRHYMDYIFDGLAEVGLSLTQVIDQGRDKRPDPAAIPGSWTHQEPYAGGGFVIVARGLR